MEAFDDEKQNNSHLYMFIKYYYTVAPNTSIL